MPAFICHSEQSLHLQTSRLPRPRVDVSGLLKPAIQIPFSRLQAHSYKRARSIPRVIRDAQRVLQVECSLVRQTLHLCRGDSQVYCQCNRAFASTVLMTVLAAVSLVSFFQPHSLQPASLKINTLNVYVIRLHLALGGQCMTIDSIQDAWEVKPVL